MTARGFARASISAWLLLACEVRSQSLPQSAPQLFTPHQHSSRSHRRIAASISALTSLILKISPASGKLPMGTEAPSASISCWTPPHPSTQTRSPASGSHGLACKWGSTGAPGRKFNCRTKTSSATPRAVAAFATKAIVDSARSRIRPRPSPHRRRQMVGPLSSRRHRLRCDPRPSHVFTAFEEHLVPRHVPRHLEGRKRSPGHLPAHRTDPRCAARVGRYACRVGCCPVCAAGSRPPYSWEHYGDLVKVQPAENGTLWIELGAYSAICCSHRFHATSADNGKAMKADWPAGPNQSPHKSRWTKMPGNTCIADARNAATSA